jgi:homoserine O-acetyltransferase
MNSSARTGEGVFELGDLALQSGTVLRNAKLAYKTHGQLDAARSNVILYPTQFAAQHGDIEWLIGRGRALDPDTYFIIVLDQLGNGLSSSPSNTPSPQDRTRFPAITILDDIAAQHRLVTEGFGIRRVALVTGYSMGAQQAFQWAASHPDMVQRIAPFCGTAKTTPHNAVFLEGVRAALTADGAWMNGDYQDQPVKGLRALARVYAGWGLSQPFYKRELHRSMGFSSLEAFITGFWEQRYLRRDANNLLSMLHTWQLNDVSTTPGAGGTLERALGAVRAKATVMAARTDLYFTPEDIEADAAHIPGARFRVIPSLWGHMAGAGVNPVDGQLIEAEIKALLAS